MTDIYVFEKKMDLLWFAGDSTLEFEEEQGDSTEVIFWENKFNYAKWFSDA